MQECLERGQQQHEQRALLGLGQPPQGFGEFRRQRDADAPAAMALLLRARPVAGQLQQRLLAAQAGNPVAQLTLTLAAIHPLALPGRKVGVLDRQLRQRGGSSCRSAA